MYIHVIIFIYIYYYIYKVILRPLTNDILVDFTNIECVYTLCSHADPTVACV